MSNLMAVLAGPASVSLGAEVSELLQAQVTPLIVDDMLSTGGTIEAAIGALRQAGAREPVGVVVTHGLLVGPARDLLRRLPISRLIVGNTVALENIGDLPIEVTSVAPLIATAIRRDHYDESLTDLRVQR